MAAYGGYAKSFGGQTDDGGGFVYGGSQQGSQGGGGKSYTEDSLLPLTIKQVNDAEESFPGSNEFRVDGQSVTQITLVAQIRQFAKQSTHHQLKLDDGTGVIEAKRYIDIEKVEEDEPDMEPDQYVRVYGRLKAFNNKRYLAVHVIRPVDDFNEVNYHLLEATAVHLYATQGLPGQRDGGGDAMFVDGDSKGAPAMAGAAQGAKRINCTPTAMKLYNFIKTTGVGSEGVHLQTITSGAGMTAREVMAAADELLGLGEIYTTLDDETWAILEY